MRKPRALLVEDDPHIADSIGDALFAVGHAHDWVTNHRDAQWRLQTEDYDYVLLDLEIPAKPGGGAADKEYGLILMEDIRRSRGHNHLPVIVMMDRDPDCVEFVAELVANGASEFITKPIGSRGRSLIRVIRKVFSERDWATRAAILPSPSPEPEATTRAAPAPRTSRARPSSKKSGKRATSGTSAARSAHPKAEARRTPAAVASITTTAAPLQPPPTPVVPSALPASNPTPAAPPVKTPFVGGTLAFHPDRVTLCDVTVFVDSRSRLMRKILDQLKRTNASGRFVAYSGSELASSVGCAGQNSVAGCVRDFRRQATEALHERLGVACGPQDVIQSGGPGYRLNEWIEVREIGVRDAEAAGEACEEVRRNADDDPDLRRDETHLREPGSHLRDDVPHLRRDDPHLREDDPHLHRRDSADVAAAEEDAPAAERRSRILAELEKGRNLPTRTIAAELGVSQKTARRDLESLCAAGQIEFVGPSRSGHYQRTA